ncbi:MAG TPA: hydroxymethylbilane synthase [Acidobacteriota bacterium]
MKYIIASRGSKLALWQAQYVQQLLQIRYRDHEWTIQTFTTTGDRFLNKPLSEFGGKGAFLKEIEDALMKGEAHLAVHSLKDVPAQETKGLQITAFLKREDPRDVWISHQGEFLYFPKGQKVGTSSLRRQVLIRLYRPDVKVELLRGNLDTRIRKLNEGQYDAIVVAAAGLQRLQLFDSRYMHFLSEDAFVPAPGQGILCVQIPEGNEKLGQMVRELNDSITEEAGRMERKFLSLFHGGCHLPIGALATREKKEWHFRGLLGGVKSGKVIQESIRQTDLAGCPELLAQKLNELGAEELLAEVEA